MSNIDFDHLFALRILLQDDFENENDIINELSYELMNMGTSREQIPNILKEFYEKFGIAMSEETIKNAIRNYNNPNLNDFLNVISSMVNTSVPNTQQNTVNPSSNTEQESKEEEQNNTQEESNNEPEDDNNEPEDDNNDQEENNESDNDEDLLEPDLLPQVENFHNIFNSFNNNIPFQNLNNILSALQNSGIPIQIQTMPISGFNSFQDVKTTLQEDEMDKIKKYKSDKTLEEKCSVCMTSIETEQEVSELPCKHEFHSECIEPWLKEYNYKCPICRQEVGKPKHNI
jgi:ribosomal protein L12E/L44/L45/RPP1/RPP2